MDDNPEADRREAESTRDRLIDEGLRLFASRGFRATTVGDIEAAAGLAPRRGSLYRHFRSKRALLEAAVERQIRALEGASGLVSLLPLGDLRAELTLLCRWSLAELSRQQDLVRALEKDGEQVPELVERYWTRVSDLTYRQTTELARRHLKELPQVGAVDVDVEVLAALAVGAVVNYRRSEWTFGHPPLQLDEERFVRGVVELLAGPVEALAGGGGGGRGGRRRGGAS